MWLFYYFNFESKSKSPFILLNKNISFDKNETESKMENPTHSFRETNILLRLIEESQIISKTLMSYSSLKKRGHFLYVVFCPKEIFLTFVFYLHTFTYQNTIHHTLLLLVFNIVESLQCIQCILQCISSYSVRLRGNTDQNKWLRGNTDTLYAVWRFIFIWLNIFVPSIDSKISSWKTK